MQPLNPTSNKSTPNKLLLAVAGLSPLVLLAPAAQARIPQNATQLKPASANSPFIDASARYNTLENLKSTAAFRVGHTLQVDDFSTGKEASDKGKESSDKGKDACDKGKDACDSPGNVIRPDDLVIPSSGSTPSGPVIQMERPSELLRSPKVIF